MHVAQLLARRSHPAAAAPLLAAAAAVRVVCGWWRRRARVHLWWRRARVRHRLLTLFSSLVFRHRVPCLESLTALFSDDAGLSTAHLSTANVSPHRMHISRDLQTPALQPGGSRKRERSLGRSVTMLQSFSARTTRELHHPMHILEYWETFGRLK